MVKTTFELNASLKNYHEKRWKKIELDCMHALLGAPHSRHAHAKGRLAEEAPRRSGGGTNGRIMKICFKINDFELYLFLFF